jgi:uncharacterized protein YciI
MPAWNDYKESAKARGSLALELYVVRSTPAVPGPELEATLPRHLAYQLEREKDGSLAFAGPLSDEAGETMTGEGMIIYRASSLAAARDLADNDPMHREGKRTYTLRRWLVNEGSFSLSVKLAAATSGFA